MNPRPKYLFLLLLPLFLLVPDRVHAGVEPCGVKGGIPMQVYIPFITGVGDKGTPVVNSKGEPVLNTDGTPKETPCYYLKPFTGTTDNNGEGKGIDQKNAPDAGELADYVKGLYTFGISIGGLVAMIMIIIGGFQWIMAGGNASGVGKAKERITGAVVGLVLLLLSYTILATINPQLVTLGGIDVGADLKAPVQTQQTKAELAERLVQRNIDRYGGEANKMQAETATAANARAGVEKLNVQVTDAYANRDLKTIQTAIPLLQHQQDVIAGTVTNIQKEVNQLQQAYADAATLDERIMLNQKLNEAENALIDTKRNNSAAIAAVVNAQNLKSCLEAGFVVRYYAGCPD